jgi:hypothetical protein
VALVFLCGAISGGGATIPVYRDGKVLLPVRIAADAPPEEHAAAEELGRVLGKMSGLVWPILLADNLGGPGMYVGRPPAGVGPGERLRLATELLAPEAGEIGPDGFRIESRAGSVFIEGATPEATGFAVAWLLQREGGVRWYAPGATGESIPRRPQWLLPEMQVVREPAYVSREITGLQTPEGQAWARRNGLRGRLEFGHALARVFPPDVMAAHPDWRPLLMGERYRSKGPDDRNWQPNLALPGVAEHAVAAAVAALDLDAGRAGFSLGMNDTVRFDQSAATRALVEPLRYFRGMPDYSPLVFTFMNRAAESLARTNPRRYLGCLAYFWCENTPPFVVAPGVLPYVTTDRTQYYDREYRAADLALMSRWAGSGVRAFGLWEYGYGRGFVVPREPVQSLAESVREGWHRGARGYLAEVEPQWGFDAFKTWMLAQLLWEPDRPVEQLADDFYPGYYGAAAGPMRRFFERCEERWMAQPGPPYWLKFWHQEDQALLFPADACLELRGLLTKAARAVANDPAGAERVARTSRAFAVTEAYVKFDALRRGLATAIPDDMAGNNAGLAEWIGALVRAEADLRRKSTAASEGELPAMTPADLTDLTRNDPVPRLLWLAGQRNPAEPRRILAAAGPDTGKHAEWNMLADALATGALPTAPNLAANGSFAESAGEFLEPRYLYPNFCRPPARWELRAMPTENGRIELVDAGAGQAQRALRIEGSWDTQLYQWIPVEPDCLYVATVRLRGDSSPGNDSALFLTFLDATGRLVGGPHMQSAPKGLTSGWRVAALAGQAPEAAAWVGIGIGSSRQNRGDWLEVTQVELRGFVKDPAP